MLLVTYPAAIIQYGSEQDRNKRIRWWVSCSLAYQTEGWESIRATVGGRKNRYLLGSAGQYSDLLFQQDSQPSPTFYFRNSRVINRSYWKDQVNEMTDPKKSSWPNTQQPAPAYGSQTINVLIILIAT